MANKIRSLPRSQKERISIGEKIYNKELTVSDAAVLYDVNFYTARSWLRLYKSEQRIKNEDSDYYR